MTEPVAVVTGGVSGIGLALTKLLLGKGYQVFMVDINAELGEAMCKELGTKTRFYKADVSVYQEQAVMFKEAFKWHSRLDFFGANAGIDDRQNMLDPHEEEDDNGLVKPLNVKCMQVNLDAVIQGIWIFKHYARQNSTPGGKVVITSSMAGLYAAPINPQYIASKHALLGLTRSIGPVLLNNDNITVNCICPAFIVTGLAPKAVLAIFPKEHITPMSTAIKAYEDFLGKDHLTGQVAELSLDQVYYREQVPYADDSQRWLIEDSGSVWEAGYASVPERPEF